MVRRAPGFASVARRLVRIADGPRWLLPGVIALNILAFLSEGFGIYLLLPLMSSLMAADGVELAPPGGGGPALQALNDVAAYFEGPRQTEALVLLIVACIFARSVLMFSSRAAFSYAGGRIGHRLRQRVFDTLLRARQSFLDDQPIGRPLNILAVEAQRLSEGVTHLAGLVTHGCAVATFLALMLLISVELTVVVGVGMGSIMAFAAALTSFARRAGVRVTHENTALSARISEGLNGLRTIRLFGRETSEYDRFSDASERTRRAKLRLDMLNHLPQPLILFLSAAFVGGLILLAGGEAVLTLVVFLALLQRMQPHASWLMQYRAGILGLAGPLEQIEDFLGDPAATPPTDGDAPARRPEQGIRFRNVRFRYERGGRAALEGVDFDIPAGATTALVGPSGAGKSTILGLLCRQIDPKSGELLVDDAPLRSFRRASWAARVAVVPQDVFLFDATIRENVAFGAPGADEAAIRRAIALAGAAEFIDDLPHGLDTRLGDRGQQFSGGQRQRIALARALVADPDILILDEATNALDNHAARLVQDAIRQAAAGRTVVIVAHRIAPVLDADHVVVLGGGRVVEAGSPQTLLRAGGAFAALASAETTAA